jgi:hypothetical protein
VLADESAVASSKAASLICSSVRDLFDFDEHAHSINVHMIKSSDDNLFMIVLIFRKYSKYSAIISTESKDSWLNFHNFFLSLYDNNHFPLISKYDRGNRHFF